MPPPIMAPWERLDMLRSRPPMIRIEDLAACFGWNKEVMRATLRGELRLASRGGELSAEGPREVSYALIEDVIATLRAGGELPQVCRRGRRAGARVLYVPDESEEDDE